MGKSEIRTETARGARTSKKASAPARPARRPASVKSEAPYHHGALREALHEAAEAAVAGIANAVGMMRQEQIRGDALTLNQGAAIARAWSMVHGFTMLLLDGRLEDILGRLPEGTTPERLLEAMLMSPVTG